MLDENQQFCLLQLLSENDYIFATRSEPTPNAINTRDVSSISLPPYHMSLAHKEQLNS